MKEWNKPENVFVPNTPIPIGPDERAVEAMAKQFDEALEVLRAFVDWHCVNDRPRIYAHLDDIINHAKRIIG